MLAAWAHGVGSSIILRRAPSRPEGDQYLDTNELMCVVMRTFGYRRLRSSALVGHFFAVCYDRYGEGYLQGLASRRDELLQRLRERTAAKGGRLA